MELYCNASALQPTRNIRAEPEIFVLRRDDERVARVIILAAERFGAWIEKPANPPPLGGTLRARDVLNGGTDVQRRSGSGTDLGLEAVLNYSAVDLD